MQPFRNTWEVYTGRFEKVLVLMLTTTLPLLLLHSYATNYIYAITPATSVFSVADIYYGFLTVLLFLFAQVPYIRFVYNEYNEHDRSLRDALFQYLFLAFNLFVFSFLLSVFSTIGFSLFIIPGFILLAILIPIPYVSIFDGKSVWKGVKEGLRLGKKNVFKILLILVITGFLELFIGVFIVGQIFAITTSFAAQIITQITLNLIYYPFVIILLTSFMIKWRQEQEVLEFAEDNAA